MLSALIIRSTKNCSRSHWCMTLVGMMYEYVYPVKTFKVGLLHYFTAEYEILNACYLKFVLERDNLHHYQPRSLRSTVIEGGNFPRLHKGQIFWYVTLSRCASVARRFEGS